jgi:hypothetical protein
MHRILAVVSLSASVSFGAGAPLCYPIVPGDRLLVPANAPAFVGPIDNYQQGKLTVREAGTDAGVRELEPIDGGARPYYFALFAPGPIARGQLLILESDKGTCTTPAPARSEVSVLDAAPFPAELGTISFGENVGFLNYPRTYRPAIGSPQDDAEPSVKRDVLVVFPEEVHPWLSMMRVTVNGSDSTFGHLARAVTPGTPTVAGSVVMTCLRSRDKFTKDVDVALEIPGHPDVVHVQTSTELDCGKAPPAPGCSSVPVLSLGLLGLWLSRRLGRRRSTQR